MEVTPLQPKPKAILYVITKAHWGGAQRYVFDLAQDASKRGDRVLVVTGPEGELTRRLRDAAIEVRHIESMGRDIRLGAELGVFQELVRIIKEFRPDVVHGNSSKAGGLIALAARISGVRRIIFTAHGWAFNEDRPGWQKSIIWLLHYATVLLSHQTLCVSKAMRQDARHMPFTHSKLSVVHNGIGPIPFLEKDEARTALSIHADNHVVIGTIAELHPVKRLDVLIEAFALIKNAKLVIIGEGQERAHLESLIKKHALEHSVTLVGHRENASRYVKAFDIFVLPSRSEGLAYVLLEAGRASLPVIASRVGGIPEVIQHEMTGLLVPSGDVGALREKLEELSVDGTRRHTLGSALEQRVRKDFSLEEMLERTRTSYEPSYS